MLLQYRLEHAGYQQAGRRTLLGLVFVCAVQASRVPPGCNCLFAFSTTSANKHPMHGPQLAVADILCLQLYINRLRQLYAQGSLDPNSAANQELNELVTMRVSKICYCSESGAAPRQG